MQLLYAYFSGSVEDIEDGRKRLNFIFMRIYDLYHLLLLLLIELNDFARLKMERAKKKNLPTEEDLNPNTKFIDNKVIEILRKNKHLKEYLEKRKFSWFYHKEVLQDIYNKLTSDKEYLKFMNDKDDLSFDADKYILRYLIEHILYHDKDFFNFLEMQSIFWVDNVDFVLLAVSITIEGLKNTDTEDKHLARLFKKQDDREFAFKLFDKVVLKHPEYEEIIKKNIVNWDFERLATVDKILLIMAICELLEFEEIPVKVILNEYIDIAKEYGIPKKSYGFINGILDKIVKNLKQEGLLKKTGRGLIE